MQSKSMHHRGMTSFFTTIGFFIMAITGLILYIVPEGRIAYWVGWAFLGLSKSQWGSVHTVSSFLFVAAGVIHLCFNWKPLKNYLVSKSPKRIKLKKELIIAVSLSTVMVLGAIFAIPPVSFVMGLSGLIKQSWVTSEAHEPPISHAEQLSLKVFAKKTNIDLEAALTVLEKNGLVVNARDSLNKISEANRTSPMNLYLLIKPLEAKSDLVHETTYTPELVEEQFSGTGFGKKVLSNIIEEWGLSPTDVQQRLQSNQIEFAPEKTVKVIAENHQLEPLDVAKVLLVKNYKR